MLVRRLARTLAAAAVVALAVVGTPAVALGQTATDCSDPGAVYPPGSCEEPVQVTAVSDSTPARGQQMRATSGTGSFDPGTQVEYGVRSTYIRLGTTTVDATGAADATFTLPTSLADGQHHVVFTGVKNGVPTTVRLPVTVSGGATGASTSRTVVDSRAGLLGALPRTGSQDLVPVGAAGITLIVVGAGVAVVARRRRQELDARTSA